MSLPVQIPQFSTLPQFISQSLTLLIEESGESKQDLFRILINYQSNFGTNKSLPIVKQDFYKKMICKQCVQQLMFNIYQWMTQKKYTVQQKHKILDTVYKLLYMISELCMNKGKWNNIMEQQVCTLSKKYNAEGSSKYNAPVFSLYQSKQLLSYIVTRIVPFYQIYEKLLDQNQQFTLKTKFYTVFQQVNQFQSLAQGKKIQANQIMVLDFLKQYIGDKPPIQEKKQQKKK